MQGFSYTPIYYNSEGLVKLEIILGCQSMLCIAIFQNVSIVGYVSPRVVLCVFFNYLR